MKVHVGNTNIRLEFDTESDALIKIYEKGLARFTGFREDGYQFTKEYKIGVWDGYTHLYDAKEHKLPTGLWNKLDEYSKDFQRSYADFNYEYVDERDEEFISEKDFPEEIQVVKGDKTLTLRDYQYNSVKAGIFNRNGILRLATNAGKCYVLTTSVLTSTGYKPFSKILEEQNIDATDTTEREIPISIPMINRYGDVENTGAITVNGVRHVNKVNTFMGLSETITDRHPMLVLNNTGDFIWVKAKDLKPGEFIVSRKGDDVYGINDYISEDEAYMLGYMIADGSLSSTTQLQFTNDHDELLSFIQDFMRLNYPTKEPVLISKSNSKGKSVYINSKDITDEFHKHYDIPYVKADGKGIPAYILDAPKSIQVAFISALFETEGSFNTVDRLGSELTSKSYDIAHNLQLMLLNMNIISRLSTKSVKKYPESTYYRLTLGSVDTYKLLDLLHFKTKQRVEQHEEFDNNFNSKKYHNGSFDTIPYSKELLASYRDTVAVRGHKKLLSVSHDMGKEYIRSAMELNPGGDDNLYNTIMSLLDDNLFFNKITSVLDAGSQPTFDLSMPETNSFIAEGLVNHNTLTSTGIIQTLLPYLEGDEKVAYIVPSKNIFEQAVDTMREQFGEDMVGYLGDGKEKISTINVIMMPSLYAKLKRPDTGLKLTGKKREMQIMVQDIIPKFDRVPNLVDNLRMFVRNFDDKGVSYKMNIKKALVDLAYADGISDAKIRMAFNAEKVKYEKAIKKQIGDKLSKWEEYKQLVDDTKLVILDEAHHAKADTYYDTLLKFDNAVYKFGMTGSIDKKDKKMVARLNAVFSDIVYEVTNDELINREISAKPTINMINIREPKGLMSKKNFQEVYATGIVRNVERNRIITNFARVLVKQGKQTLIIVNYTEHGEYLEAELKSQGLKVEFTHGLLDSNTRTEQLNKSRNGELDVLIATSVLDEGVDISGFRALIMAGGYKSPRLVLQRIGRILRRKEDDNTALVYDFFDRFNEKLYKHSEDRLKIYKDEGFEINYMN